MSVVGALAEWERAKAALGATDSCRRDGYYADAVSRAYYAVLHAARAVLQLHGYPTRTHAATNRLFGLHIVRTGRVEPAFSRRIEPMLEERMAADYTVTRAFTVNDADAAYAQAEAFLDRIQTALAVVIPVEQLE